MNVADYINWIAAWSSIIGLIISIILVLITKNISSFISEKEMGKRLVKLAERIEQFSLQTNKEIKDASITAYKDLLRLYFPLWTRYNFTAKSKTIRLIFQEVNNKNINIHLVNELLLNLKTITNAPDIKENRVKIFKDDNSESLSN